MSAEQEHDQPTTVREHIDAMEAWITEAAADLRMSEDDVWHDVAIAYIQGEVEDEEMQRDLARSQGIPFDMIER